MVYQITVIRKEPNPNFEAEFAKWNEQNRSNAGFQMRHNGAYPIDEGVPQKELIRNALICELSEEQYQAVQKAVLATFK